MDMDRFALIDDASDDDLLVPCATSSVSFGDPSPSADSQPTGSWDLQLNDSSKSQEQTSSTSSSQVEHVSIQPHASKSKASASGAFNLRKSLAWDKAFFTNEGVLDAEELAIVNSTFGKQEAHGLPSIHEDLMKSTDSISTIGSGSWTTIESLELDLFDNLRASIHKSQSSAGSSLSSQVQIGKGNGTRKVAQASKRNTVTSRNVKIPPSSSKKDANCNSTLKETPSNHAPSGHGDKKSSVRPPKAASRVSATQSKIPVPQLVQVKKSASNLKSSVNCLPGESSSIGVLGGLRGVNTRSSTMNTSSGSQTSSRMLPRVTSFNTKQGSSSSDATPAGTGSLGQLRKKVDRSSDKLSSTSTLKSPSIASKNRTVIKEVNNQRAQLKYPTRFLSGVSPSSSIESLASESSSSSTSTVRMSGHVARVDMLQMHDVCKSDSISPREDDCTGISKNHMRKICVTPSASEGSSAPGGRPVTANGNAGLKISKPSGLRMPSPKIGYFDVVDKSLHCESTRSSREGSKIGTPRTTSVSGNVNGAIRPNAVLSQPSPRPNSHMDLSAVSCIPSATKPALVSISRPSVEVCVTPRLISSPQETKSSFKKDPVTRTAARTEPVDKDGSNIVKACKVIEVGQNLMLGEYDLNNGQGALVEMNCDHQTPLISKPSFGINELSNVKLPTVDYASVIQLDKKLSFVSKSMEKENTIPLEGGDYSLSKKRECNGVKVATIEQLEERMTNLKISSEINAVDLGL